METFDIAVIGGGPAGLMAAGFAGKAGAKVLLADKNGSLGEKLLVAGKGRCNITNAEEDLNAFIANYGKNGRFLYSAFSKFGPAETIEFFNSRGIKTIVERGKRVFPAEGDSSLVLKCLISFCKENNVYVNRNTEIKNIALKGNKIERLLTKNDEIQAKHYIIATGGKSFPHTGSTGDGYYFAERAGHHIETPRPSLVPLKTHEMWVKLANKFDLRNTSISAWVEDKKVAERFGAMEFAPFGVSGPTIMDMSGDLLDIMETCSDDNRLYLLIDLKPAVDEVTLLARVEREFTERATDRFEYALRSYAPKQLIPLILHLSDIAADRHVGDTSAGERAGFVKLLKGIKVHPSGSAGFNHAIVTRGGVSLKEVDPGTLRSKICENLSFAGEVLNIDGPTGGFNLQNCWSTGVTAGINAAEAVK